MFKKHNTRRASNPLFVIFRLCLSLVMFTVLLAGLYTAYKQFSGFDPLKLDPKGAVYSLISKIPGLKEKLETGSGKLENLTSNLKPQDQASGLQVPSSKYAFRFLLIADSHSDNVNLNKAITQAKQKYPDLAFIIGMGDYSEVGTIDELKKAKVELDRSGLRYFLLVGDHDLWDARDKGNDPGYNFKQVFGLTYQTFIYNNFKFLLLNNSDNYLGISSEQQDWITQELEKAKKESVSAIFIFIHEPLFHPSSDRFMGKVEKELKGQAERLIFQLKTAGVKKVFSGDIHYFSEYEEPVTKLPMVTVGAATTERNPQVPRYAVVFVLENGDTKVEDVEIK
ncbi:metallophosphoesterase [Candidatus Daviesbacteria bacterium]|nr:metallophosphoesterase [Candidatus Daviesbacteria bacterium]